MTLSRAWTTAVLLVGIFLLVVAVSTIQQLTRPPTTPAGVSSWVEGTVAIGPPCPSPAPTEPSCRSRPLAGAVIEQRFPGGGVARTTSQQDGHYEFVWLGGGTCTIVGEPVAGASGTPAPVTITVAWNSGAHLDLRYTAASNP